MSGALFGEALDVLFVTCRALAYWIAGLAAAVTVGCVVVVAGVAWAWRRAWRAIRKPHHPPPANLPLPAPIASRRQPQPSWVLPAHPDAENASHNPHPTKEHIA